MESWRPPEVPPRVSYLLISGHPELDICSYLDNRHPGVLACPDMTPDSYQDAYPDTMEI